MSTLDYRHINLDSLEAVATRIARNFINNNQNSRGTKIFLHGELGSGKTTFAKALLEKGCGLQGVVSPTYALVAPYKLGNTTLYHIDCYRLGSAGQLYSLGIDDLDDPATSLLIEWPEKAREALPEPDIECYLQIPQQRSDTALPLNLEIRDLKIKALTPYGDRILKEANQ